MPIIVEGKYDKIALSNVVDTLIIQTNGFRIFKDREMCNLIKTLAERDGIIVMTDSDGAGKVIRNHIKNISSNGKVINIYIPQIIGKEKRKTSPSKEGFLGVEGIDKSVLEELLKEYTQNANANIKNITDLNMYEYGFSGGGQSKRKREMLCETLGLPKNLSKKQLLEVLNTLFTFEEFVALAEKIK